MDKALFESYKNDVTLDRDKYIGGSDIPAILGISPYKSRWRLLQEKAGLVPIEDDGFNEERKEYGHNMEAIICNYVNSKGGNFVPDMIIKGNLRYHADGYDKARNAVIEIKTTTTFDDNGWPKHWKAYQAQLALGMMLYDAPVGEILVYRSDFENPVTFDRGRLWTMICKKEQLQFLFNDIRRALDSFNKELETLKSFPEVDGMQDVVSQQLAEDAAELISLKNTIRTIEKNLNYHKAVFEEKERALLEGMSLYGTAGWKTTDGISLRAVPAQPEKTTIELDQGRLLEDHPELLEEYGKEVTKGGRRGYIKITFPKDE